MTRWRKVRACVHTVATLAFMLGVTVQPAAAALPTPPFTQCPAIGLDTSCAILIVVGPGGALTVLQDNTQGPYEGIEDTLVGVVNQSGGPVSSIHLSSSTIAFGFEGDGICDASVVPHPVGCPFGPTGYE